MGWIGRLAASAALLALASSTTAFAQVVPDSVPANTQDLRDFRIDTPTPTPGVETPPVPAPTPAPVPSPAPAPAPEPVTPPVATAPAEAPVARTPRRVPPRPSVRPGANVTTPVADATPVQTPEPVAVVAEPEAPLTNAPATPVVSQVDPDTPGPLVAEPASETANSALWIGFALLAALGIIAALVTKRLRRAVPVFEEPEVYAGQDSPENPFLEPEPDFVNEAPVAVEDPATIEDSAAAPIAAMHAARPQLDILFTPAAAGATDAQASVDYSLVVTNSGDAPASKVRMETRMIAMGQDHDAALAAFFAQPLEKPTPVASAIPPGVEAAMRAQVTLPRDAVRPIQVRDRTVFVPLVAFNLLYEWYDEQGGVQHGQTAMSYVVGRENRPPAAKMAPFRLDQGPKIYREVGQRVHQFKQVA